MAFDPDSDVPPPPQPGVNGVHYGPRTAAYPHYTSTAQKVFMRVAVDPVTHKPGWLSGIRRRDRQRRRLLPGR